MKEHSENFGEKDQMSVWKEVYHRLIKQALENAEKMIAASGQSPTECTPVARESLMAMIYGMLIAMSVEELKYYESRWTKIMMAAIANRFFQMDATESVSLATYLYESSKEKSTEYNANICQLVHIGIDAFYCLDRPEYLAEGMRKVLNACYENFGTGEKN